MATNPNKLWLKVQVSIDPSDEVGNRYRCPIANSILIGDQDTSNVIVTRDEIRFSRRSDGLRYSFETPKEAQDFVDELDRLARRGNVSEADWPEPFTLRLRQSDVITITRRTTGQSNVRRSGTRTPVTKTMAAVTAPSAGSSITPKPKKKAKKASSASKGSRSRRPIFN